MKLKLQINLSPRNGICTMLCAGVSAFPSTKGVTSHVIKVEDARALAVVHGEQSAEDRKIWLSRGRTLKTAFLSTKRLLVLRTKLFQKTERVRLERTLF